MRIIARGGLHWGWGEELSDENDKLQAIEDAFIELKRESFRDSLRVLSERCESPIETILLSAFLFVFDDSELTITPLRSNQRIADPFGDGQLYCQFVVGEYRADFFVEMIDRRDQTTWLQLAIECDGHEFHERTKAQARRDRARDRWMQINKIMVLRFTGQEIWEDPIACASQVFMVIWQEYIRRN